MKYLKNDNNQVFAYEDDCNQEYISKNLVEIPESEAVELTTPVLTDDVIIANNDARRQQFLNEANEKIAVLQDTIELKLQESNEEEQLKQWKKYRILLTRIDTSQFNIDWPLKPE